MLALRCLWSSSLDYLDEGNYLAHQWYFKMPLYVQKCHYKFFLVKMYFLPLHFGSILILVSKFILLLMYSLKKKIDFILIPAVNPLIETSYVADGVLCLLTWC